jgi:hypothetical protein
MKVELLSNDCNKQVSPMSEGFAVTWVNFKPYKGINMTTRHPQARRAPQVATVDNDYQRVEPGLPYPSAIFHVYASVETPWVAQTLSHFTPVKHGRVSSHSVTVEATKFAGP